MVLTTVRSSPTIAVLLAVLVAVYATIGSLYAALTPAWQVPDEPAHYNYVRSIAEGRGLPILKSGDYDQAYLERLTSSGFRSGLSVEPLEYENHQPPLYYVLATPIYQLFDGALLPLRLLSVVLGAGLLLVTFGTVATVFPDRAAVGLMAAGFIAFIPQHVAMSAGVNNDTLAELIIGGTLWTLMAYAGGGSARSPRSMVRPCLRQARSPTQVQGSIREPSEQRPWHVGLLLAAALLTKTTAYVVGGVAVAAVAIRWHLERRPWRWAARQLAWMLMPALLLSAPWFVRNGLTYGWTDPLGLARHEIIVAGQPRSSEWLAAHGWWGLLSRMAQTTFQSFWGQFGWMAVPLPARVYQVLALLSILLIIGFFLRSSRRQRIAYSRRLTVHRCLLLAFSAFLTFAAFAWYNLTFVQHQGRYLFPALIPLATGAALGLDAWARLLPVKLRGWAMAGLFAALAAFDVYCLFRIVVPNLQ